MRKRPLIIVGTVIGIIVVLVILISVTRNGTGQDPLLKTVTVERGSITVKVTESGGVQPLTTVEIKSERAGEVKKLFVEEGDSVRIGDNLALVQQETSQAQQVAQARASIERAELDRVDAQRHLERQQVLFDKGFISKKDVEDAEQAYRRSEIQAELSAKQLWLVLGGAEPTGSPSLGAKTLDNILVESPISGVVINLNVEEGEMITSGTQAFGSGGTSIMTIADLSKMIVKTDINEVDVSKVRVGQRAQIGFDAIRDRVYSGVVRKIAPAGIIAGNIVVFPVEVEITGAVSGEFQAHHEEGQPQDTRERLFSQLTDEQQAALRSEMQALRAQGAGSQEMRATVEKTFEKFGITPPGDRPRPAFPSHFEGKEDETGIGLIKPGMTADLDIIIARADDVLYVPRGAVMEQGGNQVVMLVKDGETEPQPVVTGLQNDVNVEIKEGLSEGDQVVATGSQSQPSSGSGSRGFGHPPM